jgi:hypothetical protein
MAARCEGMITASLDACDEPQSSGLARHAHARTDAGSSRPFLIAAGGTGGHVLPALQVARELKRRGRSCFFVGTERGQEGVLCPRPVSRSSFCRPAR